MSPQFNIPKTQVAAIVETTDAPLKVVRDHPVKQASELEPGECLVELEYSGVCHTDLHARNGDWPIQAKLPLIGGHEVSRIRSIIARSARSLTVLGQGVGRIVAIGEHTQTSPVKVGDRVGIKWLAYSCLDCEPCRKGLEQSAHAVSSRLRMHPALTSSLAGCLNGRYSGFTVDGTFSQYVVSWVTHVTPIPESLQSADAASILCAVSVPATTTSRGY